MTRVPRRRVDGVLLLDKPRGLTSNAALLRAKRLYNADKAGHTGTLDPLASGLLPICFGLATRFAQFLLDAPKRYAATVRFGIATSTHDAEGDVTATKPLAFTRNDLETALRRFVGAITQTPPAHSALKFEGRPHYEYARRGIEVPRMPREVTIHALELLACALPDVTFRVTCSKGTYVRTLAEDIGETLGCGAHLVALRRTGVGALTLEHAVTLDALSDAPEAERDSWLQPVDALLSTFPAVHLDADAARRFLHGQRLKLSEVSAAPLGDGRVRVYADDGARLLGVARAGEGVLAPERLVVSAQG